MPSLTSDCTSDFSKNPVLLDLLVNPHKDTAGTLNIDEHIDTAWPTKLFPKDEIDKKAYGPLPYIERLPSLENQQKENEWLELVGDSFYTLSDEKRQFLLKTAGAIRLEEKIDIIKIYNTSIY